MRVLVFHGYMLRGTGSNIYNASLAAALVREGHEVHLLCQERGAEELGFVDAVGEWRAGQLEIRSLRSPARCTVYTPEIGRTLPVYVADEYEGFDAVPFPQLSDRAVEDYVARNVAAVRHAAEHSGAEIALGNHAVMGPVILARALGGRVPFAVKIHGSALEYTVRPHRERFLPYAREGLDAAAAVLVGSSHTARSLWEVIGDPDLPARTRLGPPGVDVDAFRPRPRAEASARLRALADRLERADPASWGGDPRAAEMLRALDPERQPVVVYVGKLIVSKGVDLLMAAWPLIHERMPGARLAVVGFGTYREGVELLAGALATGDLDRARDLAVRGRELEGGPPGPLPYLMAFFDGLAGDRRRAYLESARGAFDRVHLTGRLEHADLPDLLPACAAEVVPSTFPEAFGMVAAEAAACGVPPLVAAHSGLDEVASVLEPAVERDLRALLRFSRGPGAVEEIARKVVAWLELGDERRASASDALARVARARFGWDAVARGVVAAAQGRLSELPEPGGEADNLRAP